MANIEKNQLLPNYINKLEMKKKMEAKEKNRSFNSTMLNLTVPVKREEEMCNYEIYG
jgi:hypothetical protein